MAIKDYRTDPDFNVSISGINIAEGCLPSGINNAIRQLMADVKAESEAKTEAITAAATQASSALSAFAATQAQKDTAQDAAIAEAKSSADNAASVANKALPQSGGPMAGAITRSGGDLFARRDSNSGSLVLLGGIEYNDGAGVHMYGKDASQNAGRLIMWPAAQEGSGRKYFTLSPDKGPMWDGKNVVLSVNGVSADAAGNVPRIFVSKNVTIAAGTSSIAGTYDLGFTDDKIRIGVFSVTLQLNQSGNSLMEVGTDAHTTGVIVACTNNGFKDGGCVTIPFKKQLSIKFPATTGGVVAGTAVYFEGYFE